MIAATTTTTPTLCAGCGASDTACAIKAGYGGGVCCSSCSHVRTRKVAPKVEEGQP